ncbi:MAG: phosphomannomutase/phosphoglucomutase [Phycisphaerae bacterium]|nr:phosphomannomutase/phosphoglucomutase [Phycisphaerae bacterium]
MANIDKAFKAYDVRGVYGEDIDDDLAWKIGHAAAQFLRSQLSGYDRGQASSNRLVVGHDMRPSSPALLKSLIEGVTSSGAGCFDIGMCDTPMVYFAINHLQTCGGIQVTASHNPMQYNGFKVSGLKAKPIGEMSGLREIKHLVSTLRRMPESASLGGTQSVDLWQDYRRHVHKFLQLKRPMKVVVDASNGMGGKMMPLVFDDVPNLEIIKLNYEIGQGFSHPPDPLIAANLAQLQAAVKEHGADFGICLDGDADRCMFVDEAATIVRCDLMTALLAKHFLKDNPGAMVVYDLRSSHAVAEEIKAAGGVPRRERVGHAFMKKALAEGRGVFGGELSGHFYFRDNFNCDSGAIAFATALTVLSGQQAPLSELIAPLRRYASSGEINFSVPDKAAVLKQLQATYAKARSIDHLDGVTVEFDDWWFNVRASNTEPLLRLNLEARDKKRMDEKLAELGKILGKPVSH